MNRLRPVSMLPSLATLGNLACGIVALLWILEAAMNGTPERLGHAGWLLVLAVLLDSIDGKLARLTHVTSDLGAQLDSLADAVTFGVVPGVLFAALVHLQAPELGVRLHPRLLVVAPVLYSACAILRLARFNVEHVDEDATQDRRRFAGLPSPAGAAIPVTLTLFYFGVADPDFVIPLGDEGLLLVRETILRIVPWILILLGALMVSRIPYPHLGGALSRAHKPFTVVAESVLIFGVLLVEPEVALLLVSLGFVVMPLISALLPRRASVTATANETE